VTRHPPPAAEQARPRDRAFLGEDHDRNSRRTLAVVVLAAAAMVAEIAAGTAFGSLALLADGWHMGTHVGALGISVAAYRLARRYEDDPRFAFGTGKFGDLAGFASAIALGLTAALIAAEAFERLRAPVPIAFGEALAVAVVGLAVNLASALLLGGGGGGGGGHAPHHHHHHGHGAHEDGHAHGGAAAEDNNLRAAYLHVLADALTSVLAILSLLAGRFFGWSWLDPAVAVLGAAVIAVWSAGLVRRTALALLDADAPPGLARRVRDAIETGNDRVADLRLWRVGPGSYALVLVVASPAPRPCGDYRARLSGLPMLRHVTVEVAPA
jgi:cation diffusion facilitator family transporter